jgi:D-glycero-alpha-D-manno-heptose-7-phosphate kinase
MIISKTPLRVSFVGGGSDLKSFYKHEPGAVVLTTIDKYIYVTVNNKFDNLIRLSYSQTENVNHVKKIKHRLVRSTLNKLKISGGIEITSMADIPSKGTGLGSSSAFSVGLLNALYAHKNEFTTPETLARQACDLEINVLKEPIGKQDQYAAAYGGLNFVQFNPDESVTIEPIICLKETRKKLEKNIVMFYTGIQRSTSSILKKQKSNMERDNKKIETMKKMVRLAYDLKKELQKNNLDAFGEILHENWMLKKQMATTISNDQIDEWYKKARKNGALGGKLLGAGGGGFLLFYAPENKHKNIIASLPHLRPMKIGFDYQGSRIIFIH